MRRVLVLGGTAWLGREIARQLVAAGDSVACLARGRSGNAPDGVAFIPADRSRDGAYQQVTSGVWDDVIELSYEPRFVAEALTALAPRAGHWTLVSSVSVYVSNAEPNADETAAVVDPVDLSDYAQAKVASERAASAGIHNDRLLIVRPGLISGPGDGSDRFGYWVARFALSRDEPVLIPRVAGRAVQAIDVRDLASWIVSAGATSTAGAINAVGTQHSLSETLAWAAQVAGYTGEMVEADDEWLVGNDVRFWAGPRSLPLWLPIEDVPFSQRSNAAFLNAGGQLRSLQESLHDALADEKLRGLDRDRRSGLSRLEELALLDALAESRQSLR